jgi:hypothetical protein
VRQDAYAKAHPLVVEEEKEDKLRGYYIHPELYGATKDMSMDSAHRSEMKDTMKQPPTPLHPVTRPIAKVPNLSRPTSRTEARRQP